MWVSKNCSTTILLLLGLFAVSTCGLTKPPKTPRYFVIRSNSPMVSNPAARSLVSLSKAGRYDMYNGQNPQQQQYDTNQYGYQPNQGQYGQQPGYQQPGGQYPGQAGTQDFSQYGQQGQFGQQGVDPNQQYGQQGQFGQQGVNPQFGQTPQFNTQGNQQYGVQGQYNPQFGQGGQVQPGTYPGQPGCSCGNPAGQPDANGQYPDEHGCYPINGYYPDEQCRYPDPYGNYAARKLVSRNLVVLIP